MDSWLAVRLVIVSSNFSTPLAFRSKAKGVRSTINLFSQKNKFRLKQIFMISLILASGLILNW
jgi:hypothetical protein